MLKIKDIQSIAESYDQEKITIGVDFAKSDLRVLPNYIEEGAVDKAVIFLGNINAGSTWQIRILSMTGKVVKDFGSISGSRLQKGEPWNLENDNNMTIPAGLYFIHATDGSTEHYKKFYYYK